MSFCVDRNGGVFRPSVLPFALAVSCAAMHPAGAEAAENMKAGVLAEAAAIRMALSRRDVNEILEGTIDRAEAERDAGGLWLRPEFEYSREQIDSGPGESTEDSYVVSQAFDFSGRRALERSASDAELAVARRSADDRRLDIGQNVRLRFYEVLFRTRMIEAVERWAERIDEVMSVVSRRVKAGDAAGRDLRRLEREAASASARRYIERAALQGARSRLAALLLEDAGSVGPSWPSVTGTVLPDEPLAPLEHFLELSARQPRLAALEDAERAASRKRDAAARWWAPEIVLGGGAKTVHAESETDTGFVLSASLPFPVRSSGRNETRSAEADLRIARGERSFRAAEAAGEVRGFWAEAFELSRAAVEFRLSAVEPSARLVETAEWAYRAGELGILELVDAYQSEFDAETEVLEIEIGARRARIELERTSGADLP